LKWLQKQGKFSLVHADIRNQNDITRVVNSFKPDAIFHLAGQVAMTTSISNPRMDFEVNALGTCNLLEAVREHTPNATVVYSSTNKVYGELDQYNYVETDSRYKCTEHPSGFNEQSQLSFSSPYGCSKGAADQYMLDYARIYGLNTVVFRHSSMYGGRQFSTYDQGWVGWFCQKALEFKVSQHHVPFTISGNGKQVRDLLHVDDMKRLYLAAINNISEARGNAFNIGGGLYNSLSIIELFALLEPLLDIKLSYQQIPPREMDQKVFIADIDKAKKILKWLPEINVNQGLSKMLEWIKN
jgi:CDP-paratose 2-epimerase